MNSLARVAWEAPNPSGIKTIRDGDRLWFLSFSAETMPSMTTTLNNARRVAERKNMVGEWMSDSGEGYREWEGSEEGKLSGCESSSRIQLSLISFEISTSDHRPHPSLGGPSNVFSPGPTHPPVSAYQSASQDPETAHVPVPVPVPVPWYSAVTLDAHGASCREEERTIRSSFLTMDKDPRNLMFPVPSLTLIDIVTFSWCT